jgi:hypothetical protein
LQGQVTELNKSLANLYDELKESQTKANAKQSTTTSVWATTGNSVANMNMTTKMYASNKAGGGDELPERIYIKRNSLLTEMFRIVHVRTIRHIFISIMIVLALQVIFTDIAEKGHIDVNFDLIRWGFDKFNIVLYTWFYMMLCTSCLVYFCFHYWANSRVMKQLKTVSTSGNNQIQSSALTSIRSSLNNYDLFWLAVFIGYLILFVVLPASITVTNELPVASAFIVLIEQVICERVTS